jgi:hypothetical protein
MSKTQKAGPKSAEVASKPPEPQNVAALMRLMDRADETLAKLEDKLDAVERRVTLLDVAVRDLQAANMGRTDRQISGGDPESQSGWLGREARGEK